MRKRKKTARYSTMDLSFSANLPEDVNEMLADSGCAVKCSLDPFGDFQESISEMIVAVGIHSWREMEELVYCYVAVNSPDVHGFIADAVNSPDVHGFIADAFCSVCGRLSTRDS